MTLTGAEHASLSAIRERMIRIRDKLNERDVPSVDDPPSEWHSYLAALKAITGNASIDMSFVANLLAKAYLERKLSLHPFDAAAKAQGAPGLDIDVRTLDGRRVVAEIKTTTPFGAYDFGAAQKTTLAKDFAKLRAAAAHYKFFFVTDERAFELLQRKYQTQLSGITVVHLPSDTEFTP